jgi:hypothetical protein
MSDDKKKTGSPDSKLISLKEPYEVAYWSKKFDVSPKDLNAAVAAVGQSKQKVGDFLKSKKQP